MLHQEPCWLTVFLIWNKIRLPLIGRRRIVESTHSGLDYWLLPPHSALQSITATIPTTKYCLYIYEAVARSYIRSMLYWNPGSLLTHSSGWLDLSVSGLLLILRKGLREPLAKSFNSSHKFVSVTTNAQVLRPKGYTHHLVGNKF